MTQDEKWLLKYNEVVAFIENNKRILQNTMMRSVGCISIGLSTTRNSMRQEN